MDIQSFDIAPPAAPTLNQLLVLLNTATWTGGPMKVIPVMGISRIIVTFLSINQASQAAGVKAYASSDGGTNWDQVGAGVATIITASAEQKFDYPVDGYSDFKVEYQAGTAPTVWRVSIKAIIGQRQATT